MDRRSRDIIPRESLFFLHDNISVFFQLDFMSGLRFVISNQGTQRAENTAGLSQILLNFR